MPLVILQQRLMLGAGNVRPPGRLVRQRLDLERRLGASRVYAPPISLP